MSEKKLKLGTVMKTFLDSFDFDEPTTAKNLFDHLEELSKQHFPVGTYLLLDQLVLQIVEIKSRLTKLEKVLK